LWRAEEQSLYCIICSSPLKQSFLLRLAGEMYIYSSILHAAELKAKGKEYLCSLAKGTGEREGGKDATAPHRITQTQNIQRDKSVFHTYVLCAGANFLYSMCVLCASIYSVLYGIM